ncbi:TPA: ABC transporter ATP-binding protein [Bacillus cereus]|uniref:ABC transporter ATP-binding protein n=1 Tax=Bacillus cereus TaxID=1396 RepID=A0A1D3NGV0_BACCE|nr:MULTISPECIES: ABC transporter ATP-binding protein [Bacillus]MCG3422741.1 ABC transporter ATP-binding protein/permease [Bacillus thuringiensis]MCP1179188.1 ABC transporter ATP-binding protein/permease [Bacillus sp. 1663tsa1]MCP1283848.1 ABC transporter ATP-binding protein/permease [Bacillus sp. S0635]MCQ6346144.1 ABC transporter ATP-binding protein/permease [Bacillus cereus]MCU5461527.1 ABC transporter ATP-binding protein/permease [Bacillus cereus]
MRNNQTNSPRKSSGGPGGMVAPGEKPKNFKKPWGKLIAYCKPYLPAIVFALVLAAVGTIFTIIGPNMLSEITDLITEGMAGKIDITAIGNIALLLAILYGLSFIFSYIQSFIMATITQRVSKRLRTDIADKIDKLPLKYFDSTTYGDVLSRVTNDVDMIGQTLNQSVGSLVTAVVMFLGSLIMMFSINVTMTLSAIAATAVGFVLMIFIISKSQKYFIRQQKDLGRMNGHIEEIYSGHDIVKVYNGDKEAKQQFNKINESLFKSAWRSQFMSGMMMPLMIFIGNLGYVVVCVVGATLAMKGTITFGVIVSFMVYIRLFTQPLSQLAQAATSLQSTAAASERVFEFLDEDELEDESDKETILNANDVKGNVEFKNVKFGYTKEKLIIKDFSAHIKAGQKVAIVGPTGAGKTTLVNLLMRFYEVDSGEIKIEDVPTNSITRKNVHDLFCMVLQDTWLFEGTIKENIIYNKVEVTDEEVVAACKAVGLDHFIRTLPKGYDTALNDKASLSVGQKQLLTIARAMVKKAPLLILDEATSSVDTRTEALIQEAMDKLMVGKTSFVIAHRLSTIRNADLILVMKDGDIIESGNHEELIAEKGFYADLYNSQFEDAS